jgi:hypothetical protein
VLDDPIFLGDSILTQVTASAAKELAANNPELKDFGESRENIFIQLARFVLPHRLSQKWFPEQFGVFPEWSIFRDFVAVLACVEYAVLGFMFIMFDEIFPTWSVAKVEHDGLGFSSADIGITAAFGGLSIVIIQKFIYPPFVKRTKLLPCMRLGIIIGIVVFTLFPMLTWVARYGHGAVFWICHLVIYALRQLSGQFSFTTIIQMVNNSVRLEHMGATNGLGSHCIHNDQSQQRRTDVTMFANNRSKFSCFFQSNRTIYRRNTRRLVSSKWNWLPLQSFLPLFRREYNWYISNINVIQVTNTCK